MTKDNKTFVADTDVFFFFLRRVPKAVRYAQSEALFVVQSAETDFFLVFLKTGVFCKQFVRGGMLLYNHTKGNDPKTKTKNTNTKRRDHYEKHKD